MRRMNLLDDSLLYDRAQAGRLSDEMVQRFVDLPLYAQRTGCTGILFTCSAFGPAIEAAGRATGMPTLKPNEAMFEQALALAKKGKPLQLVEVQKALADPEVREKLNLQGLTPRGSTPDELGTAMRAQLAKYGALIKQNNITAE